MPKADVCFYVAKCHPAEIKWWEVEEVETAEGGRVRGSQLSHPGTERVN